MSDDFFGTPSRRVRGKPRTPDGLPDPELDEQLEQRSSPRFAPPLKVQRRRWQQAHILEAATAAEVRRANKLLENIYEVAREIADGMAIALEHIVDTIDQRYRQEAIKKALIARKETREERKRQIEEAAKTEAEHRAKAAAKEKLRARKGDVTPARPLMFSKTRAGATHHTQRGP